MDFCGLILLVWLQALYMVLFKGYNLMRRTDSMEENPDNVKDWRQEEKGTTEDKMVGWHHQLDGPEFEQAPGNGEGQRSLACCNPWCCKESNITERLNNNNNVARAPSVCVCVCGYVCVCCVCRHMLRIVREQYHEKLGWKTRLKPILGPLSKFYGLRTTNQQFPLKFSQSRKSPRLCF